MCIPIKISNQFGSIQFSELVQERETFILQKRHPIPFKNPTQPIVELMVL